MARNNFKSGALLAPLPAVLITVGDMENSNVLTVAWTGILSTNPPRLYISVRPSRHSYQYLCEKGEFVVNIPTAAMAKITDYVGVYTGKKVDKFKKCNLTRLESKEVAAPTIKECPIALECRVFDVIKSGTHDVFLADILNVSCDDAIIDKNGRICYEKAGLLAYAHGEYFALGKKLAKFGFSTDKKGKTPNSKQKKEVKENEHQRKGKNG
jgi:flavin reductase (DIM6/NTAB) family NADH-FMN oxidoreductase RutF